MLGEWEGGKGVGLWVGGFEDVVCSIYVLSITILVI